MQLLAETMLQGCRCYEVRTCTVLAVIYITSLPERTSFSTRHRLPLSMLTSILTPPADCVGTAPICSSLTGSGGGIRSLSSRLENPGTVTSAPLVVDAAGVVGPEVCASVANTGAGLIACPEIRGCKDGWSDGIVPSSSQERYSKEVCPNYNWTVSVNQMSCQCSCISLTTSDKGNGSLSGLDCLKASRIPFQKDQGNDQTWL